MGQYRKQRWGEARPEKWSSPVLWLWRTAGVCLSFAALAASGLPVAAAEAPQPLLSPVQPGHDRPLPQPGPPPAIDLSIQAPRRSPVPRAAEELTFTAKDIRVEGVTAYSPDAIRPLVSALVGKRIHLADLLAAAERIEAKYRADGYILSRAYVPAQRVSDGIFRINVVEGYVAAVSVVQGDEATRQRVDELAAPISAGRPVKVETIEQALLKANELPGVNVSGLLRPSPTQPGASDFVITVNTTPVTASLSADNRGSKNTGMWTIAADAAARSPLDDGGQFLLSASAAPDVNQRRSLQARYVAPVSITGATVTLSGLVSHGEPAGSVSNLRLVSNSVAVGPRVSYPLLLARQEKLKVEGGFTVQSADLSTLGVGGSRDRWRNADVALVYQNQAFLGGASSATIDYARGLPVWGSENTGPLARAGGRLNFNKLTTVLQHTRPIDGGLSLSLGVNGQYSPNVLLSGEEISFGGAQFGRGYDPGALTGDSGLGGSAELRYDVDATDLHLDWSQLYAFYDAAKVWVRKGTITNDKLESAGVGVRTMALSHVSLGLEYAHAFLPLPTNDDGKRDNRLLFNGSVRF